MLNALALAKTQKTTTKQKSMGKLAWASLKEKLLSLLAAIAASVWQRRRSL
jgi:hypothetical protein